MENENYFGPGIYKHYKGGLYLVIGLGLHESEGYKVVIYKPMTKGSILEKEKDIDFWVRPLVNFNELVFSIHHLPLVPRFTFVGDSNDG